MRRGHAVALAGALLLLLVMSMDWYGSVAGDDARRLESLTDSPQGAQAGEIDRQLNERARERAEEEEKNAWQVDWLIDRILLGVMLAAILLTAVTAITRAAGAKPTTGLGPAGLAGVLATVAAVLVAYRIIQEPGADAATTVKLGAPLALLPLAMIAIGSSSALRADDREAAAPTTDEEDDDG